PPLPTLPPHLPLFPYTTLLRSHDLVLVARNRERLEAIGRGLTEEFGIAVTVLAKDLANPAAPDEIARELAARGAVVHILVNNAGDRKSTRLNSSHVSISYAVFC